MNANSIDFKTALNQVLDEVRDMLLSKNKKYGNSALDPCRVFSKADSTEGIRVRIDDKLSRIANAQLGEDEDPEFDLLGYLIMLQIAKKNENVHNR